MIYKPSNCHPFASAADISKTFLSLENKNGSWEWKQPEAVYLVGKVETSNTHAIGYRVRLYENGNLVFQGDKVSPFSELPRFSDDKTVNTGVNGTYFAVPLFQPGNWYDDKSSQLLNFSITDSFNALYCVGEGAMNPGNIRQNTTGLIVDYVIVNSIEIQGTSIPMDDCDKTSIPIDDHDERPQWIVEYQDGTPTGYIYSSFSAPQGLRLNGGNLVEEDDVILINGLGSGLEYLCVLSSRKDDLDRVYLRVIQDVAVFHVAPLYVRKGAYCGFYDRQYGNTMTSVEWPEVFKTLSGTYGTGINDIENNSFSWEIELYQGPENYSSFIKTDSGTNLPYLDTDMIINYDYDMKVANGTILGSCSKRLHTRSVHLIDGQYRLPGYGLTAPVVLVDTFCEIVSPTQGTLVPSFPVAAYDQTLGIVYPKDGYLDKATLEKYGPTYDSSGNISQYSKARFYKYSSNSEDLLSNEKVLVLVKGDSYARIDPRTDAIDGKTFDGITVHGGDRILWDTTYENGKYNGLWVVGTSEEAPTRPADGDNWADYIGKVILITGGTYAGVVMESTATAGSFELGENGLFFREQTPVLLFGESADYEVDEMLLDVGDPKNSLILTGGETPTGFLSYPFPVLDGTTTIGVYTYGTSSGKGSILLLDGNKKLYNPQFTTELLPPSIAVPTGYQWIYLGMQIYSPQGYIPYYLWAVGKQQTGKYKVLNGFDKNSYWELNTSYKWEQGSEYEVSLLFNDATHTYISPSTSVKQAMYLKLKDGAFAITSDQKRIEYIRINSYDETFNMVTHEQLAARLQSEEYPLLTPPTPYKYDVLSCYRVSDQNGFKFSPPLTPFIQPTSVDGALVAGYSVFADASCFQGNGGSWNAARLVLKRDEDAEKWQDTDWFYDGNLDTEFLGLEPDMEYSAVIYAKDGDGRITVAGRSINVPPDTAEYLKQCGLTSRPLLLPRGSNNKLKCSIPLSKEHFGITATSDVTIFSMEYDGHSIPSGDRQVIVPETLKVVTILGDFDPSLYGNEAKFRCSFATPTGTYNVEFYFPEYPQTSLTLAAGIKANFQLPPFTGTFSGTLAAESDCSTQSVLLNYEPVTGFDDWPNGLPPEQNGTYDIYKREYVNLKKNYSCDSSSNEEQLWFSDWEPVALSVKGPNVRDFNVKQGHSYQYAIVPRRGPSLKIERVYNDSDSEDSHTFIGGVQAVIGFDNSFIGLPLNFDTSDGLTASITTSSGEVTITSKTIRYEATTVVGNLKNGYIVLNYSNTTLTWPVTVDLTLDYLGLSYSARVIFTSETEFTVEPLDGSYGWRKRLFANEEKPVYVQWDAWSLAELDEVDPTTLVKDPNIRCPFVKSAYKVDLDKIWLFRYDAEPGSQSINVTKGEITTLGKYTKFSTGALNAESGEMTAWLGSEVVPGYRNGYIERRRSTIWAPVATNEAAAMLAAFRAMVASDKPKLLRDRKGRSWIVQVSGGSTSTMDNIVGTPSKISFSWKEIAPTGPYVAIWGDGDELPPLDKDGEWEPNIILTL